MRVLLGLLLASIASARSPNVLIVISDDQGWGDLGCHGNPIVKTPGLDAFAKESLQLRQFSVSPVCSPTRSSLLTGLASYHTGVVDTYRGRSCMKPGITTLGEILAAKGYRTGLFGKWHLGDHYPLRPEDRGFQTTLWHRGGGLHQPSDAPGTNPDTAYFDPVLVKNGVDTPTKGYCTDVFSDAAIEFLKASNEKPFFAYVAYNAPHDPFQVPDADAQPYRQQKLTAESFPTLGQPWATKAFDARKMSAAYGMITNLDRNFSRLMTTLKEFNLERDTIVIFLTDNGPGGVRFNGGLRNRKGTVYEGGIRVPCYVRYPAKLQAGHNDVVCQHIDITPTLDALTGNPQNRSYDGLDLSKRLLNPEAKVEWPTRTIFTQWHRGDKPEKFRAFMAREENWKLVQSAGAAENAKFTPKFELFNLQADPYEQSDLAEKHPEIVKRLKEAYSRWFDDVTRGGFTPPQIIVGGKENPVRLSRQDWQGEWTPKAIGSWSFDVAVAARYEITFHSKQKFTGARLELPGREPLQVVKNPESNELLASVELPKGPLTIRPLLFNGREFTAENSFGPDHVTLKRP